MTYPTPRVPRRRPSTEAVVLATLLLGSLLSAVWCFLYL